MTSSTTTGPEPTTGPGPTTEPESTSDSSGDPTVPGPGDSDGDGVKDPYDNCPDDINPQQKDFDDDGQGDACDPDDDNDGLLDEKDNCPLLKGYQPDLDEDGQGDGCDPDDDNDGLADNNDNCPKHANFDQANNDGDFPGDACDDDDDNDQVPDVDDNCPLLKNHDQDDLDEDGIGDYCDLDMDGDGYPDDIDPVDDNPGCPAPLLPNKVYAVTHDEIYVLDVETYALTKLSNVHPKHVDLAIDNDGIVWSLTTDGALCVSGTTGQSWYAFTNDYTNSQNAGFATFPPGVLDPAGEKVAMTHYKTTNIGVIQEHELVLQPGANYPAGYHGAGDLTHVEGIGTIAALTHESAPNVAMLARVEPTTAAVLEELVTLNGYSSEFGLATWEDRVFAFGLDGEILEFNPATLEVTVIADTNHVWRGAGGPVTQ